MLAAVAGGVAVLAMVAGEAAVRYRERHRSTVPGTMPLLFYRHERLRHALVRGYDYFGWARINRQGFRGAETTLSPDPGTFRMVVVGASTTFDIGVTADSMAWPAQVERRLRDRGVVIEVINAGVPGYTLLDQTIRLQAELHAYRPDLLLLHVGHNDIIYALAAAPAPQVPGGDRPRRFPARPNEVVTKGAPIRWLERHSLLYTKSLARVKAIRSGMFVRHASSSQSRPAADDRAFNPMLDSLERRMGRQMRAFIALARAYEVPVGILLPVQVTDAEAPPSDEATSRWRYTVGTVPWQVVQAAYDRVRAAFQREALASGVPVIDGPALGVTAPGFFAVGDPIHFNDSGATTFAARLADALLVNGMVPSSVPR